MSPYVDHCGISIKKSHVNNNIFPFDVYPTSI